MTLSDGFAFAVGAVFGFAFICGALIAIAVVAYSIARLRQKKNAGPSST